MLDEALSAEYNSFWDVRDETKGSWIWWKLLKLRPLAYSFLRCEVRDGANTHFWFDNWLDRGRLIDITGAILPLISEFLDIPRSVKQLTKKAGE